MKKFSFFVATLCALQAAGQDVQMPRNNQNHVEYSEVIRMDSIPSTQLFINSKSFVNAAFHDVKNSALLNDEKMKTLATKGSIPISLEISNNETLKAKAIFTLVIQSKDELYKYTLKDFYFACTEATGITIYTSFNDHLGIGMTKKQWAEIEAQTNAFVQPFIENLKEKMLEKNLTAQEFLEFNKRKKKG